MAQAVLTQLKEHPQAWLRVDTILEHSQSDNSRFFALQILEELIKTRWKILPPDQRQGMKNYLINLLLKISAQVQVSKTLNAVLNRLNVAIVQVRPNSLPPFLLTSIRS